MKAIVMTSVGGPEVLQLQELPDPYITRDTEILVKLKAAGVNPIDTKLRKRGTYFPNRTPTILGFDGAGIVEDIGSGVKRFNVGEEVYFCNGGIGGPKGNYAEYFVIDERYVASKPKSLTFPQAASAPLVLITAWESLHDRGRIQSGQKVLIHAGAGGVGHVAVQLAKLAGAKVCTTVSTEEKAKMVTDLGADRPILYKQTDFVQEVLKWSDSTGIDLALDTVGGKIFEKTFSAVRIYGDLVTLLNPSTDTNWKVARNRNLRISLEVMLTPMVSELVDAQQHQADILNKCTELFDQKKLEIFLSHTFSLEEAAQAHTLLEKGSMKGKIALVID